MIHVTASAPLKRAIDILETFEPASPSLLENRALQQRVDRKYVLAPDMAACIWDIQFGNAVGLSGLPGVAIAELKQPRYSQRSPAVEAFRGLHLREYGLSKYCLATTQLAQVRGNTFKPVVRFLEKLSRCENC